MNAGVAVTYLRLSVVSSRISIPPPSGYSNGDLAQNRAALNAKRSEKRQKEALAH